MHVVYEKKLRFSTNIWFWHRSLLDRHVWSTFGRSSITYSMQASTVSRYKQTPSYHASADLVCDRWCWKNTQNATYCCFQWTPLHGAIAPCLTFLESSRRADVKSWLTCNAPTYRFRDIRGQMAKIGVWEAKNGMKTPVWPHIWRPLKITPAKRSRQVQGIALSSCKISRRSVAPSPRYLSPD